MAKRIERFCAALCTDVGVRGTDVDVYVDLDGCGSGMRQMENSGKVEEIKYDSEGNANETLIETH